jgi:hypothetical protein
MNKIRQFSAKIEKKLFGRAFTPKESAMLAGFTLWAVSWIPTIAGHVITNDVADFFIFSVIYIIIGFGILIINCKILVSKQNESSTRLKIVSVISLLFFVLFMIYLYSYGILVSGNSLWITVPLAAIISSFCVFAWSHANPKHKNTQV